jgi:hypothetical protein
MVELSLFGSEVQNWKSLCYEIVQLLYEANSNYIGGLHCPPHKAWWHSKQMYSAIISLCLVVK